MKRKREDIVAWLLADPERLLAKKPFLRGGSYAVEDLNDGEPVEQGETRRATLPCGTMKIVTQERFRRELDPGCHDVLYDKSLPAICVKLNDGNYQEVKYNRVALAFQESIRQKKTLSICGNPREITLHNPAPDDKMQEAFAALKWQWRKTNQDGLDTKAVYTQMGYGDAGLLMYFDDAGRVRGRVLSYEDGYVIISHNDDNGERVMECVYYEDAWGIEHIDCYTDTMLYRLGSNVGEGGWGISESYPHGFEEIPLITKRGPVAWNNVETLIEALETLWNIFVVVQKRHGWGILYIRGRFKDEARQIAGSIILNDTSSDGNGTAEFKEPPSPQNMIDTLDEMLNQIQRGCGVTFILPKDVKTGGDLSGLAIQMTRSLDIEWATSSVIEWQNFADKHLRLFAYGFAKQQVMSGENPTALTDYAAMRMSCRFKMWQPFDEGTYNQMVCTAKQAGIISQRTAVEKNTLSTPDEYLRIGQEAEEAAVMENVAQVPQFEAESNEKE